MSPARTLCVLLYACLLSISFATQAERAKMTQQAFTQLLTGNSMVGVWGTTEYRQYFAPGGSTTYVQRDASPTHGTWRIAADGQYCSRWPPSPNESCYQVERDGDDLFWLVPDSDKVYPATVISGKQLSW